MSLALLAAARDSRKKVPPECSADFHQQARLQSLHFLERLLDLSMHLEGAEKSPGGFPITIAVPGCARSAQRHSQLAVSQDDCI